MSPSRLRALVALFVVAGSGELAAAQQADAIAPDAQDNSVPAPLEDSDPPKLVARVDRTEVSLGEPFLLLITATYRDVPEGVNLPGSIDLGPAFEGLESEWTDSVAADGASIRQFEVNVIPWQVGELLIPPIQLTYAIGGQAYAAYTEPVQVQVISFVGDGAEVLRDISGPVGVTRRDWTLVYVAAGVAGTIVVLLIGFLVVRAVRRRRPSSRRGRGSPSIDTRLPHDIALERFAHIEKSGALDADDRKPVYVELSEILRGYLGRRYGFAALDLTTSEIKQAMVRRAPDLEGLCKTWLDECDLVKFANYKPDLDEAHAVLHRARDIVIASVPRPAPAPAEPPALAGMGPPPKPPPRQPPAVDEVPNA